MREKKKKKRWTIRKFRKRVFLQQGSRNLKYNLIELNQGSYLKLNRLSKRMAQFMFFIIMCNVKETLVYPVVSDAQCHFER